MEEDRKELQERHHHMFIHEKVMAVWSDGRKEYIDETGKFCLDETGLWHTHMENISRLGKTIELWLQLIKRKRKLKSKKESFRRETPSSF